MIVQLLTSLGIALACWAMNTPLHADDTLGIDPTYDDDRYITSFEITQGGKTIHTIRPRYADVLKESTCLELQYEWMSHLSPLKPWDAITSPAVPALVVMEREREFPVTGAPEWVMRIFLLEDGQMRELPPIRGGGEVYYFCDFDSDGTLEFVNEEGHSVRADGTVPQSERVYRFDGEQYRPTR
ncbi:hypothetical protein H5P28_16975 [Ruficoccus amylovorans]|uniref:Lipoprotein n=1 Tax=Ruficoccus amylovorans TaxID=1804625 RepID=A0A842HLF2_9BACT|nr:hypothetical protein [Ruficoccus amylovorans]MBC2595961.1 hypothetical protein [Ruficoccus amylovorans]